MSQVLVLNASYEPLNITTWRRATVLMLKGKAESLEEHSSKKIRNDIKLPTVIRLRYFIKVPYRELTLNRRNLMQRDNFSCQYCDYKGNNLSIDSALKSLVFSGNFLNLFDDITLLPLYPLI